MPRRIVPGSEVGEVKEHTSVITLSAVVAWRKGRGAPRQEFREDAEAVFDYSEGRLEPRRGVVVG
jgi:hypothetical protein